jgi:hypothetical protein
MPPGVTWVGTARTRLYIHGMSTQHGLTADELAEMRRLAEKGRLTESYVAPMSEEYGNEPQSVEIDPRQA